MRREATAALLASVSAFIGVSCLGVAGCVSNAVRVEEIPDQSIAFVYYDSETARERAEEFAAEHERGYRAVDGIETRAVAPMKEITRYIQQTLGVNDRSGGKGVLGRLALLDPRTGEVELVEGARKGAIPQDWSPDHDRLLFAQVARERVPHLFELDVTTGVVHQMTFGEMAHPEGCYGPDGRIVFTSFDPRASRRIARIMITDLGGGSPQQLSLSDYSYYPACAPDGGAVAYTTFDRKGRTQHVLSRSPTLTGEPRVLSPGKEPSFSADGEWIVFSSKLKRKWSIWRIRPDGTGRASLGRGGFDEERPSLSPDGHLLVYVADTNYHQRLYLRRIDGSGDRLLLADGDGDRPVW